MSRPVPARALAALRVMLASLAAAPAFAAAIDGSIDGAHVSHVPWQDCRPLCPVDHQAFAVLLYAPGHDLSGVRVRVHDAAGTWVTAAVIAQRGPYDVWQAQVPAAVRDTVRYYFELSDGTTRRYWGSAGFASSPPADSGFAVDFAALSHAPLGATPVTGGTVFRVWAPGAVNAWVEGDFNAFGTTDPMARLGDDFLSRVPGAVAGQRYQYAFDGSVTRFDPRGRILVDPISGPRSSRLDDPAAYTWTSASFTAPPLGRMVVYQLDPATFCGLNDPDGAAPFPSGFADVAARVHQLAALGVNAVMLNPVTSAPDIAAAGYDCISPWPPEAQYGTPAQLKLLVDTCHRDGIAVLCDIVWNHVAATANELWDFDGQQVYFATPAAQTASGPQADFSEPGVADFYEQSALQWLEEYRIDGLRMDGVESMAIGSSPQAGWALMQRLNADLARRGSDKVTIAASIPPSAEVTNPVAVGGAAFAAQYDAGDVTNFRFAALDQRFPSGYPAAYDLANTLALPGGLTAGHQSLRYIELHADAWDSLGGHRLVTQLERSPGVLDDTTAAILRTLTAGCMLGPGVPAMLMGDEWLEEAPWGTGQSNRIDWSKRTLRGAYVQWMHDLIHLRTHLPAFDADAPCQVVHLDWSGSVVAWMRHDDAGNVFLVVANLGGTDFPLYALGAPLAGAWVEELDSHAAAYGGSGNANGALSTVASALDGMPQSLILNLPQTTAIVLRAVPIAGVPAATAAGGTRLDAVFPSPMRGSATVAFTLSRAAPARLDVYDAGGARVARLVDGPLAAGPHLVHWSGRDDAGRTLAPGIYFVHLDAGGARATRKLAVLR